MILRNRNKEKMDSPFFDTSSSQALYGLAKPKWGVTDEKLLTKSKSESNLRKVGVDPNTLQSYLLDSLWLNLETPPKAEEIAPIFQNIQFPNPLSVPNRPTTMAAARFSPLALPLVLHDLPLNYAQIFALYDGEGNVSVRYHVGNFDYFNDLEEVDEEDVKM